MSALHQRYRPTLRSKGKVRLRLPPTAHAHLQPHYVLRQTVSDGRRNLYPCTKETGTHTQKGTHSAGVDAFLPQYFRGGGRAEAICRELRLRCRSHHLCREVG